MLTRRFEPCAKEYLEAINPVLMPLRTNCWNTRIILEWVQDTLGADVGTRRAGTGPEVRRCTVSSQHESAERFAREIAEFIDIGGLAPGSVTILSPFDYAKSSVAYVPAEVADRICCLDEYSVRSIPGDKVGFARIDEFKGLENEAIIVVDLFAPNQTNRESAAHYVAMTGLAHCCPYFRESLVFDTGLRQHGVQLRRFIYHKLVWRFAFPCSSY